MVWENKVPAGVQRKNKGKRRKKRKKNDEKKNGRDYVSSSTHLFALGMSRAEREHRVIQRVAFTLHPKRGYPCRLVPFEDDRW